MYVCITLLQFALFHYFINFSFINLIMKFKLKPRRFFFFYLQARIVFYMILNTYLFVLNMIITLTYLPHILNVNVLLFVTYVCLFVNMFCHRGPRDRLTIIAKRVSLLKYCINKTNKEMKIIYSMYRASEVSVQRACCGGGGEGRGRHTTLLAWRGRYDLSRFKTSRCYQMLSENGNRVFAHSLDVN